MKKMSFRVIITMMILVFGTACAYAYDDDYDYDCAEHNFVEVERDNATCGDNGWVIYACPNCGDRKFEDIPATGDHSFGEWYMEGCSCVEDGYKYRYCTVCDESEEEFVPAPGHQYKPVEVKASLGVNGGHAQQCEVCLRLADVITYYAPETISFSKDAYHYDGKAKKPKVTVFDSEGQTIDASNYRVSYPKGRTKVGSYKVTVTFKESSKKYKGELTKSFVINPPKTKITRLTSKDGDFTVKWQKKAKQVDGYQIHYGIDAYYEEGTKTVKGKNATSKTIETEWIDDYSVKVRTYKTVNGKRYYSDWSSEKGIRIKNICLNTTETSIAKGGTWKLKMQDTKGKAKWSSSNKKVAVVNQSGKVTGKKPGKAVITAKVNGKKYTCTIHVMKPKAQRLERMAAEAVKKAYESVDFPTTLCIKEITYERGHSGENTHNDHDRLLLKCYSGAASGGGIYSHSYVRVERYDFCDVKDLPENAEVKYKSGFGYYIMYYYDSEADWEYDHKYSNKKAVKAYQKYFNTKKKIDYV